MIWLIGMPGCGKSYWGQRLATHFGVPFIDLDSYIVQTEQRNIADIFQREGEVGFRDIERGYLRSLLTNADRKTIVATGGGTPIYADNMTLMQQAGRVLYLRVPIAELANRLQNEVAKRPLLQGATDLRLQLEKLYAARVAVYEQAQICVPFAATLERDLHAIVAESLR
jgi:shikimate kinase